MLASRLTFTTTLGFDALGAEISTSPVHDPAVRPEVLICTLSVPGVAPCVGVTTSQLFPHVAVLAVAVKLMLAPVLLVTLSVCEAGADWPIWKANESCAGLTLTAGVPAIVTSTGTLMPVVPGALMAMAPLNTPEPLIAAGLTVTWKDPGRLPDVGNTESHEPPPSMIGVAVNVVRLDVLLETVTAVDDGTVLPAAKLKLNEFGTADKLLGLDEFAFKVTGIVRVLDPGPDTLIKPTSVPDVGAPEPIETEMDSGVEPELGLTCSQLLSENADTERLTGLTEDVNNTVCAVGVTPFCVLNVSCAGVAVSVVFCAWAVSKQHSKTPPRSAV